MQIMKANTASRTAQIMAFNRALETLLPEDERLFNDPYAHLFLDRGLKMACTLASFKPVRLIVTCVFQSKAPGALSSAVARTKYIDDLLQQATAKGIKQLIILGAGFDTRSSRLLCLNNIAVIEIDHPNTSKIKQEVLKMDQGGLPSNTQYLQIDFNVQNLEDLLVAQKINFNLPTAILWEGVTNYLSAEAIDNTFQVLQRFGSGSIVIFTYIDKQVLDNPARFKGAEKLMQDLGKLEERWTFGFKPASLASYLLPFRFDLVEDKNAVEYRAQYLTGNKYALQGYEFYHVAMAKRL